MTLRELLNSDAGGLLTGIAIALFLLMLVVLVVVLA